MGRDLLAKAFNAGSDARLAGLPLTANPHEPVPGKQCEHHSWMQGWQDVHRHYSKLVASRWKFRKLPSVKVTA